MKLKRKINCAHPPTVLFFFPFLGTPVISSRPMRHLIPSPPSTLARRCLSQPKRQWRVFQCLDHASELCVKSMSMRRICALNALYEPWAHLKTSFACLLCGKHVNASQQAARKPVSLLARFFVSTPWCPLIDAMVSEIRPLFVEEVEPQMDWIHSQHAGKSRARTS